MEAGFLSGWYTQKGCVRRSGDGFQTGSTRFTYKFHSFRRNCEKQIHLAVPISYWLRKLPIRYLILTFDNHFSKATPVFSHIQWN